MNLWRRLTRFSGAILFSAIGLATLLIGFSFSQSIRSIAAHPSADLRNRVAVVAYPNCRFGMGQSSSVNYDAAALNLGWYLNWRTEITPTRPNAAEYFQVVRLQTTVNGDFSFTPPTATLQAAVLANPGAVWLIGNEPDSPVQDNLLPEVYARAYHHLYTLIKGYDDTAQIGAGGIVQPTPLRFQYLDRVLAAYRAYYSQTLPADLWNVHSYILREITADDPWVISDPTQYWGALVPPGSNTTRGELYTLSQMYSQSIFRQRLIDFRSWMARNGYRDVPLVITEYGTLYPYPPYIDGDPYVDENLVPMTEVRTATFMTGTFNILQTLTDPGMGYRNDGGRLVQRWAWYSADDVTYGGILFYTATHALNPLGQTFATHTSKITPTVDLFPLVDPVVVPWGGAPLIVTLKVAVANQGNISASHRITVTFYAGPAGGGSPIGMVVIPAGELRGCGGSAHVSIDWPLATPGAHPFLVKVASNETGGESNLSNNVATAQVLLSTARVFLPRTMRAQ
jgi:hypothetical protein